MTDTPVNAPAPAAPPPAGLAEETQKWRPPGRRRIVNIVIVAVGVAALIAVMNAWGIWPFSGPYERTENAFVHGRTTVIAPQVSGYVVAVAVRDYQRVRRGQILVRIDDSTYRARVAQARANLDAQIANLANNRQAHASSVAGVSGQNANLANAQAQLARARADMARVNDLVGDGSVSIRERDQTLAALRQAEAQVNAASASGEIARQGVRTVDVGRAALEAQVEAARAALRQAQIDLYHTVIRAPEDGQLGQVGVHLGQWVTNGTQLFALVPFERWIIANYKEAQTAYMAPGQRASFTVDALDGARLTGRVARIAPATGSAFSVLPADNATGNFVKIPQRIGIYIAVDGNQPLAERLRPGMSVETRVDTRSGRP